MAKQDAESKMHEEYRSDFEQAIDSETNKAMMQLKMQRSKKAFTQKRQALAERAAEFVMQYGKEDYRAQLMLTFLDVSLQMEDAINLLHDVSTAMSCIGEAIGCIDDILATHEMIIQSSMVKKYGFFQRLKRKRALRRAIRNNVGRMEQVCDSLVGSQEMALVIVNALKKSSIRMKTMMEKNVEKQNKRAIKTQAKSGDTPPPPDRPSAAESMVADIVRAKTGSDAAFAAPSAHAPAAGKGIDDISDIL